jgi:hypothetical protein
VIIGDSSGKTPSVEILAELIPIAKARYAANRGREGGGMPIHRAPAQPGLPPHYPPQTATAPQNHPMPLAPTAPNDGQFNR